MPRHTTRIHSGQSPIWVTTEDTEECPSGYVCEDDHIHEESETCELQFQCDACDEAYLKEWEAEACCPGYECDYCGYVHSYREAAEECCWYKCSRCEQSWHGDDGHDCDNGRGDRDRPMPWEQRGIFTPSEAMWDDTSWKTVWQLDPEELNVVRAAADYYLLEAIKSGLVGTTDGAGNVNNEVASSSILRVIRNEAQEMFDDLVAKWDPILQSYTHIAVGGELRHHNAVGGTVLSVKRSSAWAGWSAIVDAVGPDALKDAADLFRDFECHGFGGEKWADASLILHSRLTNKITPALFLDRIFNAQHNGGCLLNKVDWNGTNNKNIKDQMTMTDLHDRVLPAHGVSPEPKYSTLLAYASTEVRDLFADGHEYARRSRLEIGLPLADVQRRPMPGETLAVRNNRFYLADN